MKSSRREISQTMETVIRRRPALKSPLLALEPLLAVRTELASELETRLASHELPAFQPEAAKNGIPLLADFSAAALASAIRLSAAKMLPLLLEREAMAPYKEALESFFLAEPEPDDLREALLEAVLENSRERFEKISRASRLPQEILEFMVEFILSPVMRALARRYGGNDEEFPWNVEGAWGRGYCPVCGSFPSIGWLERARFDEKNAFLAGGGGKKYLHCSLCGSHWNIRRGVCPSCGREGEGVMQILRESGEAAERLDWCAQCQSYCPTVDLREMIITPDMDAMALGMIHLDMVAAERNLLPLKSSFWNRF